MWRVTSAVRTEGLDAYIRKLPGAVDDGAERTAQQIAADWRSLVHVITGSYRASIGVQTHTHSEYGERAGAARALNPRAEILPEPPKPARKGAANVFSAVKHALFEELGTRHRPPHPAFTPAVERNRGRLKAEIAKRLR